MKNEYGYMIKTINIISKNNKYGIGFNNFKYPLQKGAKVITDDWNNEPVCYGGIFGLIHETKNHCILDKSLWVILKYEKGTEVVVDNGKIKVPYAWVEAWGNSMEMQVKFKELTGKEYKYDYAIQTSVMRSTQTAGKESTQTAVDGSRQTAGFRSTQIAGHDSTQIAGHDSTQTAGDGSTQTAGDGSTQTAVDGSRQTAGFRSTQIAGYDSTQIAGHDSTQTAGEESTQTAGEGSVSIIRGKVGYCKHDGKVLQILCFYDYQKKENVYLTKIINDNLKHKLEAVKNKNRKWILKDTIIQEEK